MEKKLVVISRKWHEPFIRIDVTEVGIGVTMSLEDFIVALAKESGIEEQGLIRCAERVCVGMKQETNSFMSR